MKKERIAELRFHCELSADGKTARMFSNREVAECLAEIERLQRELAVWMKYADETDAGKTALAFKLDDTRRENERLQAALATQETLAEAIVHLAILESADAETRGWNAAVEACAVKCHRGVWTAEVPPPYESGYRAGYDAALLQAQEAIRALLKPTTKESM